MELLQNISLDQIENYRSWFLIESMKGNDAIFEAVCRKFSRTKWEEWGNDILDATVYGMHYDDLYEQQIARLRIVLQKMSVKSVESWYKQTKCKNKGRIGKRLYQYAFSCTQNTDSKHYQEMSIQELCLVSTIMKEYYFTKRDDDNSGELLVAYITSMGAFIDRYYSSDIFEENNKNQLIMEIEAISRMYVAILDGKASIENITLLKQALSICPVYHQEIKKVLKMLK